MKYTVFLMNGNVTDGYGGTVKLVGLLLADVMSLLEIIKDQDAGIAVYLEGVGG